MAGYKVVQVQVHGTSKMYKYIHVTRHKYRYKTHIYLSFNLNMLLLLKALSKHCTGTSFKPKWHTLAIKV